MERTEPVEKLLKEREILKLDKCVHKYVVSLTLQLSELPNFITNTRFIEFLFPFWIFFEACQIDYAITFLRFIYDVGGNVHKTGHYVFFELASDVVGVFCLNKIDANTLQIIIKTIYFA